MDDIFDSPYTDDPVSVAITEPLENTVITTYSLDGAGVTTPACKRHRTTLMARDSHGKRTNAAVASENGSKLVLFRKEQSELRTPGTTDTVQLPDLEVRKSSISLWCADGP